MLKINAIKPVLLLLLLFFSNSAFSTSTPFTIEPGPSAGTFTCNYCPLTGPGIDSDTVDFIKTEVNKTVESWIASNLKAKSVTICNATHCAVYQYFTNGNFAQISISPITSGGGGGGGFGGGSGGGFGGGHYNYVPIYDYVTSCVSGYCETHLVIVGYEKIFIPGNEPQ